MTKMFEFQCSNIAESYRFEISSWNLQIHSNVSCKQIGPCLITTIEDKLYKITIPQ